jgi:hypothetical protein
LLENWANDDVETLYVLRGLGEALRMMASGRKETIWRESLTRRKRGGIENGNHVYAAQAGVLRWKPSANGRKPNRSCERF